MQQGNDTVSRESCEVAKSRREVEGSIEKLLQCRKQESLKIDVMLKKVMQQIEMKRQALQQELNNSYSKEHAILSQRLQALPSMEGVRSEDRSSPPLEPASVKNNVTNSAVQIGYTGCNERLISMFVNDMLGRIHTHHTKSQTESNESMLQMCQERVHKFTQHINRTKAHLSHINAQIESQKHNMSYSTDNTEKETLFQMKKYFEHDLHMSIQQYKHWKQQEANLMSQARMKVLQVKCSFVQDPNTSNHPSLKRYMVYVSAEINLSPSQLQVLQQRFYLQMKQVHSKQGRSHVRIECCVRRGHPPNNFPHYSFVIPIAVSDTPKVSQQCNLPGNLVTKSTRPCNTSEQQTSTSPVSSNGKAPSDENKKPLSLDEQSRLMKEKFEKLNALNSPQTPQSQSSKESAHTDETPELAMGVVAPRHSPTSPNGTHASSNASKMACNGSQHRPHLTMPAFVPAGRQPLC